MATRNAGSEVGSEDNVAPPDLTRPRRGRMIAFRVAATVFALVAFGGLFGFGVVLGWFDNDLGGIHRVHEIGFGVLYGVLLTTACVALIPRPERRPSAFWQIVAVGVASVLGGALSANGGVVILGAIVLAGAAVLFALHPARATVVHPGFRPNPVLAAVAVLGSVPLVALGLATAKLQRTGSPADPHVHEGHWAIMSAMAFGLVLCGLLAAGRTRGWRVTAWCAGLGLAVYGLASVVFATFPGTDVPYAGSEGVGWGLAAIAGGLVFVGIAEWQARAAPDRPT
ncbi:MAG TPA: hypothetical protein VNN79_10465 [Actinomycetota bacterium]|nr:hypothetical protein [Actinomycetota bacterium]